MSLLNVLSPDRCGRNYWDVWDWPQSLLNQNFGLDLNDNDWILQPSLRWPTDGKRLIQRKGVSEVVSDSKKFQVKLDCSHFKPEEIEVKTIDNSIVIHGKHEEKMDKHGWVSREFTRRYALPEECETNDVKSSLHSNGVLTIEAPKRRLEAIKDNERVVPIQVIHESTDGHNGQQNQIQN